LLDADDYPEETGATHEENARIKARFGRARAAADAWVVGEDSGIWLDALGGRPGVHSARWDADPVGRTLRELAGRQHRGAHYRCSLVCIGPRGGELAVEGRLDGRVADAPRGHEGFGYDPIFVPLGEERTVAELGDGWKASHSHRALAAAALREALEALSEGGGGATS
jgi:XTP/dITP diphosphohydrolase